MLQYVLKRIIMSIFVLIGVSMLIFFLLELAPGDPALAVLGENASPEAVAEFHKIHGLDDPALVRYARYLWNVLHGDLGTSYSNGKAVAGEILTRFPTTVLLAFLATVATVIIGVPLGILTAIKRGKWVDTLLSATAMIGVSMPGFWLGLMLIYAFSLKIGWLPASGFYGPVYWILPTVTMAAASAAAVMRTMHSSMLEVVRQDYIRTARAKGVVESRIIFHHMLRNSLIPVITVIGLQISLLFGGTMVIETVFSIPGLGKFLVTALKARDYPICQGGVLLVSCSYSIVSLGCDLLYAFLDPRIRASYQGKKKSDRKAVEKNGK